MIMIKILLHIYLVFLFIIDFFYLLTRSIFLLPKTVFEGVIKNFKDALIDMPHKLRKHLPYYDSRGLRHSIEYLQSIRIEEMIKWTFEEQAEFADQIVVNFCRDNGESDFNEKLYYKDINATSIGNAAYIILNHPSLDEREKAYQIMNVMENLIIENQ